VAREPGTTRDNVTARVDYKSRSFWLVDTAGLKNPEDDFEITIQEQILEAIDSADVIWVVVEANIPITDEDRRIASIALKSRKPVFLVVNKIDKAKKDDINFERLGIKPIFLTSTTQNQGIDSLLEGLVKSIPKVSLKQSDNQLHLALLGRPNVGKSLLFNTLAKKQQAIVSSRAGTTRDINRVTIQYKDRSIEIMDTAGIRRPGKIEQGVEHFSVLRSLNAIEQSDICLLLMDVNELNVQLDQKIAGMIKEAGKGLILVVTKWDDLDEKTPFTWDQIASQITATYDFVPWAPLIVTSSITGQNVTDIFDIALSIDARRHLRIRTTDLNRWLQETISKHPPAGLKNRSPKLNYMVQETDNPTPAFKIFGSQTKFIHWSYRRFLERELRERYDFSGSALQLWFIEKHEAHRHGVSPTKEGKR
jgi:GTP-binding protein